MSWLWPPRRMPWPRQHWQCKRLSVLRWATLCPSPPPSPSPSADHPHSNYYWRSRPEHMSKLKARRCQCTTATLASPAGNDVSAPKNIKSQLRPLFGRPHWQLTNERIGHPTCAEWNVDIVAHIKYIFVVLFSCILCLYVYKYATRARVVCVFRVRTLT